MPPVPSRLQDARQSWMELSRRVGAPKKHPKKITFFRGPQVLMAAELFIPFVIHKSYNWETPRRIINFCPAIGFMCPARASWSPGARLNVKRSVRHVRGLNHRAL